MINSRTFKYKVTPLIWIALGLAALLLAPPLPSNTEHGMTALVLWTAVITIAAMSPVPLPRGGSFLLSPALDLGALLVFGPAAAAWYGVVSRLIAGTAERWTPFHRTLSPVGAAPLALVCAGFVYRGITGPEAFLPVAGIHIPGFLVAGVAYSAVMGGTQVASGILDNPNRPSSRYVRWFAQDVGLKLLLVPFAALLAVTQVQIGILGVALFLLPLLLVRYAIKLWIETRQAHMETVRLLVGALDDVDPFTRGYSLRVAHRAVAMARHMQLPEKEVEDIEYAALLHDIGRTAILRETLNKAGRLSKGEQEVMQTHPRVGYEMVRKLGLFSNSAGIVLSHHEQPNGEGYPLGTRGDGVPLGARIISVASAYDAMTSDRPYRRGLSPEEAIEELLRNSGTQFFPEVVEALIAVSTQGEIDETVEVYTSDMPKAVAVSRPLPEKRKRSFASQVPMVLSLPGPEVTELHLDLGRGLRAAAAAASDLGCVRENNEDSMLLTGSENGLLMVVSDGVGGAAAGEVASRIAVETAERSWKQSNTSLVEIAQEANRKILERASQDQACEGMASTFTALSLSGSTLELGHVGDSRAYLISNGQFRQLTEDHTLETELRSLAAGAEVSGAGHVLTRSLGINGGMEVDVCADPPVLEPGDIILLCSDGLTGVVSDEEMVSVASKADPLTACRKLIDLARDCGGPDNITVLISKVEAA